MPKIEKDVFVEISHAEYDRLRLTAARWDWHLRFIATVFGETTTRVIKRLDENMERGESPEQLGGVIRQASRSPGVRRPPTVHHKGLRTK